jgi:hypothetical protein
LPTSRPEHPPDPGLGPVEKRAKPGDFALSPDEVISGQGDGVIVEAHGSIVDENATAISSN